MFEGFVDETVGPRVVGLDDVAPGAELADQLLAAELLAPCAEAGDHSPAGELAWQVASAEGLARLEGWARMTAWVQAQEMISIEALVSRAVDRAEQRPPGTLLDDVVGGVSAEVDSVVAELALVWQVAQRTAARRVDEAVSLVSGLPLFVEAMLDGRLGLAHVRAVGGVLLDLDPGLRERLCRDLLEGTSAGRPLARTPAQLAGSARRAAVRLDPSSARRRERAAVRERGVHLGAEDHGMATVTAYLPAAEALLLYRTLDAHARRADPVDPEPASVEDGDRTPDARRADALCDLVALGALAAAGAVPAGPDGPEGERRDGLDDEVRARDAADASGDPAAHGSGAGSPEPTEPTDAGGRPRAAADAPTARSSATPTRAPTRRPRDVQIRVVVPADTLLGLDDRPGELVGYGPITADTARALAAEGDATWRRVLTDPATGAVLDVGHQRYRPPAAMAEHVRNRDLTCTFPGCRVPAQACDLDHLVPYGPDEGDGRTAADNLGPECRHHHRIKHLPGWAVARGPDGSVLWTTPTGRRYRTVRPVLLPATADVHASVTPGPPDDPLGHARREPIGGHHDDPPT
ncbi:HNH endonuclease signature motif containing protein [Actinomycetospora straminea]|uniref:DUF222 domain-containing protein n=1 Tax=Actinomycetospora straminea TaxID=663607 RepID=A0ABP9EFR1_9PSEU|nr:DUF222 domain-containing protein [Actinomycetospora straminea]MDD7934549.1 DUF222 domain-containing protein [Actinomycetospora straminea]